MKLYPTLRYDDPRAAHDWLQRVIGFEPVAVHEGKDGAIEHAEMRWGEDLIMVGPSKGAFPRCSPLGAHGPEHARTGRRISAQGRVWD